MPAPRRPFSFRRKTCPFSGANAPQIDYKDVKLLLRYTSEGGVLCRPVSRRFPPKAA